MKYLVMQVYLEANGNLAHPTTVHDTLEDAYSRYYNILGVAVKSEYALHGALITTEELFELEHKIFKHTAPASEPEEPEVEENN